MATLRERLRQRTQVEVATDTSLNYTGKRSQSVHRAVLLDANAPAEAADVLDAIVALKPRLLNVYGHPGLTKSDDETFRDLLALIEQVER